MTTYVYRPDAKDADEFGMVEKNPENNSSDAPYIISDEMQPLRHMADGKMYSSKHKFREATKASGCIEIGNEDVTKPRKPIPLDRRQRREDIRRAIHDLRDGRAPTIRHILDMNKD